MTPDPYAVPDDLRVALTLFSRAAANFAALDTSARAAVIAWLEQTTTEREREDRLAEVAVRANADELADLVRAVRQ